MKIEENPKPIFMIETLTPTNKENLVALIKEYIDVFIWNYKNMLGLDPQIAMHHLNIKSDIKPVKQ